MVERRATWPRPLRRPGTEPPPRIVSSARAQSPAWAPLGCGVPGTTATLAHPRLGNVPHRSIALVSAPTVRRSAPLVMYAGAESEAAAVRRRPLLVEVAPVHGHDNEDRACTQRRPADEVAAPPAERGHGTESKRSAGHGREHETDLGQPNAAVLGDGKKAHG